MPQPGEAGGHPTDLEGDLRTDVETEVWKGVWTEGCTDGNWQTHHDVAVHPILVVSDELEYEAVLCMEEGRGGRGG